LQGNQVRHAIITRTAGALCAIGALWLAACTEEPTGPSAAEFKQARMAAGERAKQGGKSAVADKGAAKKTVAKSDATAGLRSEKDFTYDATGKRDPFRSFEWERLVAEQSELRGPLEQFDVTQLSLVAIVWNAGRPRAMVQDPSGQTYIIAPGTRIGKNLGRVLTIGDNAVMIKETYVDLAGQETTKEIELSIRRSQGG
jgi:Tfp pilus assembly protein PilP